MSAIETDYLNALPAHRSGRSIFWFLLVTMMLLAPIQATWAQAPKPDANLALILVRDALTALNHANWTGNYTVLRDYASPNFASANDPVRLTAIFQPIRSQGLDLAVVLTLVPKITKAQLSRKGKRLQIAGYFGSKPKQIHFDLIFEDLLNRWRLFGIGVWGIAPKPAQTVAVKKQNSTSANEPNTQPPVKPARQRNRIPVPKPRPFNK